MSETIQSFRTTLEATGSNNVGIVVPDGIVAAFGRGKRVPVTVTVDGAYTFSASIAFMGGRFLVSFNSATRAATERGVGDEIEVRLELDDAPRTVEVPETLRAALAADAAASVAWNALSPSRQKAHVLSVSDAKTDQTRQRWLDKLIETLRG